MISVAIRFRRSRPVGIQFWSVAMTLRCAAIVLGLTTCIALLSAADPPAKPRARDVGKGFIEAPVEALVAAETDLTKDQVENETKVVIADQPDKEPATRVDVGKYAAEFPTKELLARTFTKATAEPAESFVNPKVEPGLVRWHESFESACSASEKSGKPVLLFQMMGNLDDRFC
jgi:hypothetical protein